MTEKRGRGRPTGSGKDDTPHLRKVADLLIENATMKPTTAINKVIWAGLWTESEPTLRRRWQVKWKTQGANLLAEAQQARETKRQEQNRSYNPSNYTNTLDIIRGISDAVRNLNPAYLGIVNTLQSISKLPLADLENINPLGKALGQAQSSLAKIDSDNSLVSTGYSRYELRHRKMLEDIHRDSSLVRIQRMLDGKGY